MFEKVAERAVGATLTRFADERQVTESRRKLQRKASMEAMLPERVQHRMREPSHIRVDKSRQRIFFTWAPSVTAAPPQDLKDDGEEVTSALAEYLRVYTPSTDGTFATDRVVYGRRGVLFKDITPIGNYALRITFSDDHNAGIYSYDYLYHLTCSEHKYRLMRQYISTLRAQRKSRDPPRRAPSRMRLEKERQQHS